MNRPSFSESHALWRKDGSLRDVYVAEATESDWSALFAAAGQHRIAYTFDGVEASLPDLASIFGNREGTHALSIFIGAAVVRCYFFVSTEIELDIDPREVATPETHDLVLGFLEALGRNVGKPVALTEESSPEDPLATYTPSSGAWRIHGPTHNAA